MKKRPLCMVCLVILIAQTILFLCKGGASLWEIPASSIFYDEDSNSVLIQGQVYQKRTTSKYQILYLKNNSVYDSKLMVYDTQFTEVFIGQIVSIQGTISPFERAPNPGNFDQALYYARQGFYGFVWCENIWEIGGEKQVFWETLYQIRTWWKEEIMLQMGQEKGAVLAAILLGEKSDIDPEVKELYQKNGIGHILAISGLHISFIGYGIYLLCRKSGMGFVVAGVLSILCLTVYTCMIGFSVSIFRAFVMFLLKIGADMTGRVYDMLTALALAAVITITYEPLYLTDGGFYMSYGAILGIGLILPLLQQTLPFVKSIFSGGLASLSVSIMLLPIFLYFYYEIPLYSIWLNMLVVPLMSLVLSFGLIGSLFLVIIPPIGQIGFIFCKIILQFYERICRLGLELPGARLVLGKPKLWALVLYYIVLAFVILIVKKGRKTRKVVWMILFIPMLLLHNYPQSELEVCMLDVGQGDSIFLQGPNGNTYLIDGGSSDVEEVGKYRLEPFLTSKGIRALDYVFVTHGDADHYSGIEEMLSRKDVGVEIQHLVFPCNFQKEQELYELALLGQAVGCKILTMEGGDDIYEGELKITCLQPNMKDNMEGNAGSMILDISYKDFSMLCTGDVEGVGEERLIENIDNKVYDVLKVSHHGSKYSTSEEFLQCINPKIALISSGKKNSYGHPHDETIRRLEKRKCAIYQTIKKGAITITTDGNSLTISLLPFRL